MRYGSSADDRELSDLLRLARHQARLDLKPVWGSAIPVPGPARGRRRPRRRSSPPRVEQQQTSSPHSSTSTSPERASSYGSSTSASSIEVDGCSEMVIPTRREGKQRARIFDDEEDALPWPLQLDDEDYHVIRSFPPRSRTLAKAIDATPVLDDPLSTAYNDAWTTDEVMPRMKARRRRRGSTPEPQRPSPRRGSWSSAITALATSTDALRLFSRSTFPTSSSPPLLEDLVVSPLTVERAPWAAMDVDVDTPMMVMMQSMGGKASASSASGERPPRLLSNGRYLSMLASELAMIRARKIRAPLRPRAVRKGKGEAMWARSPVKAGPSALRYEVS